MSDHDLLIAVARAIEAGRDAEEGSRAIAEAVVLDLDRAGYVIRKKPAPRKATTPVEPFSPNTGDASVDEFMRKHHDPKRRILEPKLDGIRLTRLNEKAFDRLQSDWESACAARRGDSSEAANRRAEDAETLASAIRMHRSPWGHRGDVYSSTEHGYTIERVHPRGLLSSAPSGWKLRNPDGEWIKRTPPSGVKPDDNGGLFYRFDDAEAAIPVSIVTLT